MKIYGRNSVLGRLRANPKTVRTIYLQEGFDDAHYVHKKARKWGIPIYIVPRSKMLKIARDVNSQGILIEVADFSYLMLDELLEIALDKKLTIVFLDGLNDPQNLGAIMRSLACLGKFAICLPTHDSVKVTDSVLKIASGADNYIHVCQVSNLSNAIRKAKEAGFWIAGTFVKEGEPIENFRFQFPLGLVIGSEQKGIREVLKNVIDMKVNIPMADEHLSLNVSHAVSILAYEINKQKSKR